MSYKVKSTIVSMVNRGPAAGGIRVYAIGKVQSGAAAPDDMKFWATAILMFIGIGIAAMIVIQIVFHILLAIAKAIQEQVRNGKCDDNGLERSIELDMVEDEMDKLISLKSMQVGFAIAARDLSRRWLPLVLGSSPAVMLNILFASFFLGSLCEGAAQLFFYWQGVKNS